MNYHPQTALNKLLYNSDLSIVGISTKIICKLVLYGEFVLFYCLFFVSKDISIGYLNDFVLQVILNALICLEDEETQACSVSILNVLAEHCKFQYI
jgi:hypothetical protein